MPRILVIDDDAQLRKMLRKTLENAGYMMIEAPDGVAGAKLFREDPADLVITDIVMEEGGGLETIMSLRRDFPNVKILAISGGGKVVKVDFLSMAKSIGAQLTLEKPFGQQGLLDAVQKVLGSHKLE